MVSLWCQNLTLNTLEIVFQSIKKISYKTDWEWAIKLFQKIRKDMNQNGISPIWGSSQAFADELFECFWLFCEVGA